MDCTSAAATVNRSTVAILRSQLHLSLKVRISPGSCAHAETEQLPARQTAHAAAIGGCRLGHRLGFLR